MHSDSVLQVGKLLLEERGKLRTRSLGKPGRVRAVAGLTRERVRQGRVRVGRGKGGVACERGMQVVADGAGVDQETPCLARSRGCGRWGKRGAGKVRFAVAPSEIKDFWTRNSGIWSEFSTSCRTKMPREIA